MYYNIKKYIQENKEHTDNNNLNYLHKLLSKHRSFSLSYNYLEEESFIDKDLPIPTFIRYYEDKNYTKKVFLVWVIDGYFKTKKAKEYFNDIKTKLNEVYKTGRVDMFIPFNVSSGDVFNNHLVKLNSFQFETKSKTSKVSFNINKDRANPLVLLNLMGKDPLFNAARWEVYNLKKEGVLTYENTLKIFEKYGNALNKSLADITTKAKNVYEWTKENYRAKKENYDNIYYKEVRAKKDKRMKREEFLKKLAKDKVNKTKEAVLKGISLTLLAGEKLTIVNISKNTGVSRVTLNKEPYKSIIKEYKEADKAIKADKAKNKTE